MKSEAIPSREAITALVVETLMSVDTQAAPVDDHIDESTELLGKLDSLGLVTLIIDLEERLEDDLGVVVVLATERALSRRESPFRTVGTLSDYVVALAGETNHDDRS